MGNDITLAIVIGGFYNTPVYIAMFMRQLMQMNTCPYYLEFHSIEQVERGIIDLVRTYGGGMNNSIFLIPYSMSCVPVLHLASKHESLSTCKIIMIDPCNLFCKKDCIPVGAMVCDSYKPFKEKGHGCILDEMHLLFEYPRLTSGLLAIAKNIPFLVSCFVRKKASQCVYRTAVKQNTLSLKKHIENNIFKACPLTPLKHVEKTKRKLYIITGSNSEYLEHCKLLAEVNHFIQLHTLQDEDHHMLYEPSRKLQAIMSKLLL